jgi:hypothetical protein
MKNKLLQQKKRLEEIVKKRNFTMRQAAAMEEAKKHLTQVIKILKDLGHQP